MVNRNPWIHLTNRELEILQLLADGWCNKQIADKLCITVRTVKFHTNNIYLKIMVGSRAEAIVWMWHHSEARYSAED